MILFSQGRSWTGLDINMVIDIMTVNYRILSALQRILIGLHWKNKKGRFREFFSDLLDFPSKKSLAEI
jgi:hypothetical protein